ncbi:MAG: hypothetical protein R3F11_17575 [Verrucomicrobiales bacterium]
MTVRYIDVEEIRWISRAATRSRPPRCLDPRRRNSPALRDADMPPAERSEAAAALAEEGGQRADRGGLAGRPAGGLAGAVGGARGRGFPPKKSNPLG